MHFGRADLQLDTLITGPDQSRVDRAVIILFGGRDVILEAAGHERPGCMYNAERAITVVHRLADDAETKNIGQLLEANRFALHFPPNRIGPFAPSLHLSSNPAAC